MSLPGPSIDGLALSALNTLRASLSHQWVLSHASCNYHTPNPVLSAVHCFFHISFATTFLGSACQSPFYMEKAKACGLTCPR